MKQLFLRVQWVFAALVASCLPVLQAQAQTDMEIQPGVVISSCSIDEHLDDVEYIMEASGFAQMAPLVRIGTSEYLRGLDTTKPIGSMLFFEEDTPEPKVLAFIPVTDIDDVLDTIAPFVDIDEEDDKIVLTADDGTEFTVKESGGFAFVTDKPELLGSLPDNPLEMLEKMHESYNLAAKVYGQNIPETLRAQAIELIREGYERSLSEVPSEMAELQMKNFEYSMKSIESIINETDEVLAGLAIDKDEKRIYIDVKMVGLPGSKFARQSAAMANAPTSKFAGFLNEGSAMNFHVCSKLLEDDIPEMENMINELKKAAMEELETELDGEQAEVAGEILTELVEVFQATIREGVIDGGGTIDLDETKGEFAMGMRVAKGRTFENACKKIAGFAEQEPDVPVKFNFDVSSEGGINYHEILIEVPVDEEEIRTFFGEEIKVLVGISENAIYLASGKDPKGLLSKAMNQSASGQMPAAQYNLHVAPILRFISVFQDDEGLSTMAEALTDAGNDRVRIQGEAIENGQQIRIEFQDGFLKMIGAAAQQFGGGFGPPQDF